MRHASPLRQSCLRCSGALKRVHRLSEESRAPAGAGLRRYRCVAEGCGWQGLLARLPRTASRPSRFGLRRRWRLWSVVLASFALLGVGIAAIVHEALKPDPGPPKMQPGQSHYGVPLPAAHPLQVRYVQLLDDEPALPPAHKPLSLRRHCVWGKPGGNPYRGSVEQALRAADLPDAIVQTIAYKVRSGDLSDRLEVRNDGIHALASGRIFSQHNIAMSYGMTLCLGTSVNFVPGHVEPAVLYEAADGQGRVYSVMVPEVCGNVSVLGQRDPQGDGLQVAASGLTVGADRTLPAHLDGRATQELPEPAAPLLVLAGLALLAWQRRRAPSPTSAPERP